MEHIWASVLTAAQIVLKLMRIQVTAQKIPIKTHGMCRAAKDVGASHHGYINRKD